MATVIEGRIEIVQHEAEWGVESDGAILEAEDEQDARAKARFYGGTPVMRMWITTGWGDAPS